MMIKDFLFKTKTGGYSYGSKPSWPIFLALALQILKRIAPSDDMVTVLGSAVAATLAYWAYLEIARRVNNARRILGLVIGFIALTSLISSVSV